MKIIFIKRLIKGNTTVKKLSKYVAAFDYIDKISIVLSAASSGICIISSGSVVGGPVRITSASFTLIFFFNSRNNQKIAKHKNLQKEKA